MADKITGANAGGPHQLPVGDLPESLRQVNNGGGEVVSENPEENYAVIRDLFGVFLALRSA